MRWLVVAVGMAVGGLSSAPPRPQPPPAATNAGASTSATTTTTTATVDPLPMSDPDEYAIPRISRDAGKAIFARTGIGDPYRTGVPYPIFLALLAGYPGVFGATTTELADKFGFVARAADPKSSDADLRAG